MPKSKAYMQAYILEKLRNPRKPRNMISKERLINLVNDINTTRKDLSKMQTNLPARLMQLNNKSNQQKQKQNSQVYAKSVSSTFSSMMHNGHTHSQGKKIINDSTKPYVQIDEMQNGNVQHYMIPKNTIPYKPNKLAMQINLLSQHPTIKHHTKKSHPTKKQHPTKKMRHTKKSHSTKKSHPTKK